MKDRRIVVLEFYVGAFVVTGLLIIAGMIIASTGGSSWFADTYRVIVEMPHIGDLKPGAPVKLGGFTIGKVASISLANRAIEVDVDIGMDRDLAADSKAQIANSGLVGDTFLEFVPGTSSQILAKVVEREKAPRIEGISPPGMTELLTKVQTIGDAVTSLLANVNKLVGDEELQKNIKQSVTNVNMATDETNKLLVTLRGSAERIQTAVDNVVETTASIRRVTAHVENAIQKTIGDERQVEAINQSIANMKKVTDALGGRSEEIAATLHNIRVATDKVAEITNRIQPDRVSQAVDRLAETLTDVQGLVATVRREITTALIINKAADRIVAKKFEEMGRRSSADEMLKEIRRWVQENLYGQGRFDDPQYPKPEDRPYHPVGKTSPSMTSQP